MSTINNTTDKTEEPAYKYHVVESVTLEADGRKSYSRTTFSSSDKLFANEAINKAEELGNWRCDGGVASDFSGRYFVECTDIAIGNIVVLYDEIKDDEEEEEDIGRLQKQVAMLWALASASSDDIIGDLIAMKGDEEVKANFSDDYAEAQPAEAEPAEAKTEKPAAAEAKTEEPAAAEAKTEEPAAEDTDLEENTDDSEEEEELAGDLCYGASDPYRVITYTMAGGGAHWWEYEVHYDDEGQQERVYKNDTNGSRVLFNFQWGRVLFYYEDQADQLRLEDTDFEEDGWYRLEYYA